MRRTPRIVAFATGVLVSAVLGVGSAVAHPAGPLLRGPSGIAAGPDGNMWFTESTGNRIGRITMDGVITEFASGLSRRSSPEDIAAGPDGNMWFTQAGELEVGRVAGIGRITMSGAITEFSQGIKPGSAPWEIAAGPDGNLWFTEINVNKIGRITTDGFVTQFSAGLGTKNSAEGIAAGPDGDMWFTQSLGRAVGRISTTGIVTRPFLFPTDTRPEGLGGLDLNGGITADPHGNVWFTEFLAIGRISRTGSVTHVDVEAEPEAIAAGPDGTVWFTGTGSYSTGNIGRITYKGRVTEFTSGLSVGGERDDIAAGPDGNMWFTEFEGNRIGRITPAGVISEFPATAQILRARQVGMRVAVRLRCPVGAALACKGTVRLGKTGTGGARRLPSLSAGRTTTVVIPISPKWRQLLAKRGRLAVKVWLLPVAHSMAGALSRQITLRAPRR